MGKTVNIEEILDSEDISVFDTIPSQTSASDRKSLLAMQNAVRSNSGSYVYLEIGSHLGGTIQPHLHDPKCRQIYSIDKRPMIQPDERGLMFEYEDNSTRDMLDRLEKLAPGKTGKIKCIDSDAREINPASITDRPDICFIDGEHTTEAALSDFNFCRSVCNNSAIICFHDSHIIHKALIEIIKREKESDPDVSIQMLTGTVLAIGINCRHYMENRHIRDVKRSLCTFILKSRIFMLLNNTLKLVGGERLLRAFYNRGSNSQK